LKYFTTLKSNEIRSIAIGGFDGMHLGHQALIKELCEYSVILVIDKGLSNLTPGKSRYKYFKNGCIFLDLKSIKGFSSQEFISLLEDEFTNLEEIVVGYDFHYGAERSGDTWSLKREFKKRVTVVDEVIVDGESVHSVVIRDYIRSGNIVRANTLLGRSYTVKAHSVKGQGVGSKELVPTINLVQNSYLMPLNGVYATKTKVNNIWYKSVTFIGHRKVTDGAYAFETHLIDIVLDFLPSELEVEFIEYIRENREFTKLRELKKQIEDDIIFAKNIDMKW
jgi:riboflavin kinase/FMN adenylyltransferase